MWSYLLTYCQFRVCHLDKCETVCVAYVGLYSYENYTPGPVQ